MVRTLKEKLNDVFRQLRSQGFVAKQNYMCCMSCATAAINIDGKKGGVYYHRQDANRLRESGECHIRFVQGELSDKEVGCHIASSLLKFGICFEWDGNPDKAIFVREKN